MPKKEENTENVEIMAPEIIGIKNKIDAEIAERALLPPSEFPLVGKLKDQRMLVELDGVVNSLDPKRQCI